MPRKGEAMTGKARRWVLHFKGEYVAVPGLLIHAENCTEWCAPEGIPVVPAADYDALAKRVEELEKDLSGTLEACESHVAERDAALRVVSAARATQGHAACRDQSGRCSVTILWDALAAFDKQKEGQ